jgi:hypothetical protein
MLLVDEMETMTYTEFIEQYRTHFEAWIDAIKNATKTHARDVKQEMKSFAIMYIARNPSKAQAIVRMRRDWERQVFSREEI